MIKATEKQIKGIIQETHPEFFTYRRAKRYQAQGQKGFRRRTWPRKMGWSKNNLLSVELIGSPKRLRSVRFLTTAHEPRAMAVNMRTVNACLKEIMDYNEKIEAWLMDLIGNRRPGEYKNGGIKYMYWVLDGTPVILIHA